MAILQKYLGWLQRYWYTVESQAPPFSAGNLVVPVTELGNEPFEWKWFRATYHVDNTAPVSTTFVPANPERRRLVVYVSLASAVVIPAADNFGVTLIHEGLAAPIVATDLGLGGGNFIGLVGVSWYQGAFDQWINTGRPIMVGPRDSLQIDHTSVAPPAGLDVTIRCLAIDLPKDAPFPNVF